MASLPAKHHLSIDAGRCFLATGVVIETLLAANLLYSCSSTFDCTSFWPTISYMAAYRGHDRLFTFTLTLLSLTLPLFFLSLQTQFQPVLSQASSIMMLLSWLGISVLVPAIAVIDEANSSNVAPLEVIHYWLMVAIIGLGLLWTSISLVAIRKGEKASGGRSGKKTKGLEKYVWVTLGTLVVTVIQWTFAGSVYANCLLNESVEAVCEWTTVSLVLFAPYTYVQAFPCLEISFVGS